jgi:hypothetical protein
MGLKIKNSKNIVTDGLIFHLDASDKLSYSGSGSTWVDRINNSDQTFSGAVFQSNNGGGITFDGTDDKLPVTFPTLPSDRGSIAVWIKKLDSTSNTFIFNKVGSGTNRFYIRIDGQNISAVRGSPLSSASFGSSELGDYNYLTMTWDSSELYAYKNAVMNSSNAYTNPNTNITSGNFGTAGFGNYGNFTLASTKIYNKTLSATEILQNYNATKGRFGL